MRKTPATAHAPTPTRTWARSAQGISLGFLAFIALSSACGGKVVAWDDTSQTADTKDAGLPQDSAATKDTSSIPDLGTPDLGLQDSSPAEFCSGEAKLQIGSQVLTPLTITSSEILMNCCEAYDVRLHVGGLLGQDLSVGIRAETAKPLEPGDYAVTEGPGLGVYATAYPSDQPYAPSAPAQGTLRLLQMGTGQEPLRLELCLRVAGDAAAWAGLRLYLPNVPIATRLWDDRLELRLLEDPAITALEAGSVPLNSLELSGLQSANLGEIAYYRQSTHTVFWNTSIWSPALPSVGPEGVPFVVLVDKERVYLGAFASQASSVVVGMPVVYLEQMTAATTTISAPSSGPDPRSDPRVLGLLSEAQRLIP